MAECNQPVSVTSFTLSDLVAFFHRWPRSYCAKPAWIQFGSGCVRFLLNRSDPEASQCARRIRHASGQCFRADPDQIQHVYWVGDNLQDSHYAVLGTSAT